MKSAKRIMQIETTKTVDLLVDNIRTFYWQVASLKNTLWLQAEVKHVDN